MVVLFVNFLASILYALYPKYSTIRVSFKSAVLISKLNLPSADEVVPVFPFCKNTFAPSKELLLLKSAIFPFNSISCPNIEKQKMIFIKIKRFLISILIKKWSEKLVYLCRLARCS